MGFEDIDNRIGAKATPGPKANIRILTLHHFQILKWLQAPRVWIGFASDRT